MWLTANRSIACSMGGLITLCLLVARPCDAKATANPIVGVHVEGAGEKRSIRVETRSEPTFTVFRLADPMRIVLDVSGGDISALESPIRVDDGIVTSIATRQFDANGFLIGRLTVGFEKNLAYDVKAEGNAVVIRIAPQEAGLGSPRVIRPSAPLTEDATKRVERLRREVEAARRLAEQKNEQLRVATSQASSRQATATRLGRLADVKAREAASARAETDKLRNEVSASSQRAKRSLEIKLADAQRRLERLQEVARKLNTERAEAERASAKAARENQEKAAAAARANALYKKQVAEQQQLIAAAKAERAKAKSEKDAAEAARKRAVAATREAERAKKEAESQQKSLESAAEKADRKLAEIDRRERMAQQSLASLTAHQKEIERDRASVKRDKRAVAQEKQALSKARESLAKRRSELERSEARLNAERELLASTKTQHRDLTQMQAKLVTQRKQLAEQKDQLSERQRELDARQRELEVSTRALIKQRESQTLLASTTTPSRPRRGLLRGVENHGEDILLRMEGKAAYELLRVEDPPRLVVRLDGVRRKTDQLSYRFEQGAVRRVRIGDHDRATHVVFDLETGNVEHSVRTTQDGVLVRVAKRAPKATDADPAFISDVQFDGSSKSARIVVSIDGEAEVEVDDRSRRAWVLKVKGAKVKKQLERSLDTAALGSVVRLLSTYQASTEPPVVNIVANLRGAASQELRREDGRLIWELRGAVENQLVAKTIRRESKQSTAAFRETAQAMSRSVVPTQRRSKQRVTLDFKDADIINVIRLIADTTGENIIISDEVKGKVTVKLRNVPWEKALDVILMSRGYDKVRSGGIIRISTAAAIRAERENAVAALKARTQVEPTVIKIVTVNYAQASAIVAQLKPLLSVRGSVQVDERTNALIIEDLRSNINRLVELTGVLDKQTPLVLIEARIVEASSNFEQEFGIQWGGTSAFTRANGNPTGLGFPSDVLISGASDDPTVNPTQGITNPGRYAVNLPAPIGAGSGGGLGFVFGSAGSDQLLQLRLSALESSGSGRIISSPRITTLDNKTARIGQGVDIPITVVSAAGANTRLIPANLELEVTPHVTNDGGIVMEIKAQKNEPDFTNTGAFGDPSIVRNFAETEILVADGETAVIGGIYTRSSARRSQQVPLLGDLPLIGWLFRNERQSDDRSELLVFITPRIVNRDEALRPAGSELRSLTPG